MIETAVSPIASPAMRRRQTSLGTAATTGDAGCPNTTPNRHADIMKVPNSAPSMRYSRQCFAIAEATGLATFAVTAACTFVQCATLLKYSRKFAEYFRPLGGL